MTPDDPTRAPSSPPGSEHRDVLSASDLNLVRESRTLVAQQRTTSDAQWMIAFATLVIALATFIVSIASYLQSRATRDALAAIQTQAASAGNAAPVSDQATPARLVIDHYALTKPLAIGEVPTADITIKNTGGSTVSGWHSGFGSAIVAELPDAMPVPDSPEDGQLAPDATAQARLVFQNALSAADFARLRSGDVRLYFFGRLTYSTAGTQHRTEFCFSPVPPGPTSRGLVAMLCPKWNEAN